MKELADADIAFVTDNTSSAESRYDGKQCKVSRNYGITDAVKLDFLLTIVPLGTCQQLQAHDEDPATGLDRRYEPFI